jgi:hypothetical protein
MMFSDPERREAGSIGEDDLVDEIAQALRRPDGGTRIIGRRCRKAVDADFHTEFLFESGVSGPCRLLDKGGGTCEVD